MPIVEKASLHQEAPLLQKMAVFHFLEKGLGDEDFPGDFANSIILCLHTVISDDAIYPIGSSIIVISNGHPGFPKYNPKGLEK